jgi:hypothetical protein
VQTSSGYRQQACITARHLPGARLMIVVTG